jgi:hypothetical protein
MELLGDFLDKKKQSLLARPSRLLALNSEIGVEVEFENVLTTEGLDTTRWQVKEDHSLHNRGLEFVFKGPMFGEDIIAALDNLYEVAAINKYVVSQRTGIHVHLDSRDMTRQQLIGLLAYYCMFEPAIYNWVGDQREANNFCLPYYKALGSLEQVQMIIKCLYMEAGDTVTKRAIKTATTNYHRYAGLNLKSLIDLGSLEFRHLKTTMDKQRVIDWINIIFSLKDAALRVAESTSQGILSDVLANGPSNLLSQTFSRGFISQLNGLFYPEMEFDFYTYGYPNAAYILGYADKVRRIKTQGNSIRADGDWNFQQEEEIDETVKSTRSHKSASRLYGLCYPKDQQPNVKEPPPEVRIAPNPLGAQTFEEYTRLLMEQEEQRRTLNAMAARYANFTRNVINNDAILPVNTGTPTVGIVGATNLYTAMFDDRNGPQRGNT